MQFNKHRSIDRFGCAAKSEETISDQTIWRLKLLDLEQSARVGKGQNTDTWPAALCKTFSVLLAKETWPVNSS